MAAKSWLPFTASVLVALSAPAAMLVSTCAAPGAAPVPFGATSASWSAVPVRCTGPAAPFWMLAMFWLVAKSWLPFTASVLDAPSVPAVRLVIFTPPAGALAPPVAPSVIVLPPTASYFTAMLAVLVTLVFSAVKASATEVFAVAAVAAVTAPVVLTLSIGWLKPVMPFAESYVAPPPSVFAVVEPRAPVTAPMAWLVA